MNLIVSAHDVADVLRREGLANGVDDNITADFEKRVGNDPELQASAAVIFMASPKASDCCFKEGLDNPIHAVQVLCEAVSILCRHYIGANLNIAQDMSNCCLEFSIAMVGNSCLVAGDKNINKEAEKNFLSRSKDIGDTKKRMKILAALDIARRSIELETQIETSKDVSGIYAMFAYVRSMAQFLFFEYYADGISMQMKREAGAKKPADRAGIRLLIDEVRQESTQAATKNSVAWRAIRKILIENGLKTFDNGYGVEFETDNSSTSPYSGHIVQTDPDGKEYKMSHEAFKAFFRQVKKEGGS
jgi:hypothetical protein